MRGIRKYSGGESNSPVEEWLNKGLMQSVSSPGVSNRESRQMARQPFVQCVMLCNRASMCITR
eukprot:8224943-Pyramimonas_sp.AAC.1